MSRAWPWIVFGSGAALIAAILYSLSQHAEFTDVLMRVLLTAWS